VAFQDEEDDDDYVEDDDDEVEEVAGGGMCWLSVVGCGGVAIPWLLLSTQPMPNARSLLTQETSIRSSVLDGVMGVCFSVFRMYISHL